MRKDIITKIPKEKFKFTQSEGKIHDKELQTKPVGYFKDAFRRFRKNKSSVVGAIVIILLVVYAIVAPVVSPYATGHKDMSYRTKLPINNLIAPLGFWDGASVKELSASNYAFYQAIAKETGIDPIFKVYDMYDVVQTTGSGSKTTTFYKVRISSYLEVGVVYKNLSLAEYQDIQNYQNENNIQIIYPMVDTRLLNSNLSLADRFNPYDGREGGGNYWYELDGRANPILDANGNLKPAYLVSTGRDNYNSIRTDFDNGTLAYASPNESGYRVRICYVEYYKYINGRAPSYLFGTTIGGYDMFSLMAKGAQFSLILAVFVSIINLTIGTIYGAIEGYYGGKTDMIMERIADVLNYVPFVVVVALFQFHFMDKVGSVVAFLFCFILVGWLGMAGLVRRQFYRFKNREYVMAARTLGAGDLRVMFKHIFPNSLGTIITSCAMVIPGVISTETMFTFLGIIDLTSMNTTSLGALMSEGNTVFTSSPHALFFPAIFMSLLLICFNLFGNGLRDAFNPSLRGAEG